MQTLVLDSNYRPIRVEHYLDVMADLLCTKRVYSVVDYKDKTVSSVRMTIPIPAVVAYLTGEESRKKGTRFSRENIWLRDRKKCAYCLEECGRKEFTLDHIIPRAQGGKTTWENVVVCCYTCNQRKGNRTPAQSNMKVKTSPRKPDWLPPSQFTFLHERGLPAEWKQFLRDFRYWNGELENDER